MLLCCVVLCSINRSLFIHQQFINYIVNLYLNICYVQYKNYIKAAFHKCRALKRSFKYSFKLPKGLSISHFTWQTIADTISIQKKIVLSNGTLSLVSESLRL